MIEHQIFVNKHLPIQTRRKMIFDLLKINNEDTIAVPLT